MKTLRTLNRPTAHVVFRSAKELERIVVKCLAKQPTDRYTTAADLATDLRRWLATTATPRRSPFVRSLPTPPRNQPPMPSSNKHIATSHGLLEKNAENRGRNVGQKPPGKNRRAVAVRRGPLLPAIMESGNAGQSERAASDFFRGITRQAVGSRQ